MKDGPFDSLPPDEIRAIERWESLPDPNAEERDRLAAEVVSLRAELAAAKAEPQRPAAIVRVDITHFHAFESIEDAAEFERTNGYGDLYQPVESWTWHPARAAEGEGETS